MPDNVLSLLVVAAVVATIPLFWVVVYWLRYRRDRGRILEEAEKQRCETSSIRWLWLPWGHGPFSWWEWGVAGCRTYRIRCRKATGQERIAYVLIGPRRPMTAWDSTWSERAWERWHGTLTWRWEDYDKGRTS